MKDDLMESGDQFAFLLPVMMALFGAAFLIVWQCGSRQALFWGCGYLSASLAFCAPFFTGVVPIVVQALTADFLFFAAWFFFGHAVLVHFDRRPQIAHRLGACVLGYSIIVYVVAVRQDLAAELLVSDLTCAYLLAIPLFTVRNSSRHAAEKALIVVAALVVSETVIRNIVFTFMQSAGDMQDFFASPYAFVMQVGAMIGGIVMALTALAAVTVNVVLQYREAAEQDALTGLLNRRGFERAIARDRSKPAAVMTCDIDHFKRVNDTLGHATGDRVLCDVAKILGTLLPKSAAIARFGGEEFVACLPGCSQQDAHALANVVRLTIEAHDWRTHDNRLQITASFGIDDVAPSDHSIHDALARADQALYAAKKAGRNQVMPRFEKLPDAANLRLVVTKG